MWREYAAERTNIIRNNVVTDRMEIRPDSAVSFVRCKLKLVKFHKKTYRQSDALPSCQFEVFIVAFLTILEDGTVRYRWVRHRVNEVL